MTMMQSKNTETMLDTAQLLDLFRGQFEHEREAENGTPSGNYYWFRKRKEITSLLSRNMGKILKDKNKDESISFADIGCGCGIDLFVLRDCAQKYSSNFNFIGLDGSPMSLDMCKLKKEYYGADNLELKLADLTSRLPFEDQTLDIIYCSEVVEHLIEPELLLNEMRRVLKPNGFLLLTTPNEPNPLQRTYWDQSRRRNALIHIEGLKETPYIARFEGKEVPLYGHISCRTNRQWDQSLKQCGMRLVDYGRGGIVYGSTAFSDREWSLGARFFAEGLLDLLPKFMTRDLSHQLIGLYQVID